MSPSRICIVAPEFIGPFPNGGVGTACYWEAHTLGAAGYDVTVLYTGPTERESPAHWQAHFAAAAPFDYVDLGGWAAAHAAAQPPRAGDACPEADVSDLVLAWLQTRSFDLVLFQEFLGHGARALQARHAGDALDGVRAATTMHSCRQWVYEGMQRLPAATDSAVDALEKTSARLADRVIVPSRHMADWAASRWRLGSEGAVIPYCFDAAQTQAPAVVTHTGPFRHLVFFGRLETRKGLHLFCRALTDTPELRDHVDQVTFLGKASSVEGQASEAYIAAHMAKMPGVAWRVIGHLGSFEAQAWLASQTHALVVAPSLVDNLPYAVIELQTRRLPFVSTNIGGIPEIVGDANRHVLAEPTATSLASVIARICRDGRVVVDYGAGYDVAAANAAHVQFVRNLLAQPAARVAAVPRPAFDVVVTNVPDHAALANLRERLGQADGDTRLGRWMRFEDWPGTASSTTALFIDCRVQLDTGSAARLCAAAAQPDVAIATSYYLREDAVGEVERVTPLGPSLESGWRENTFGGPCFVANPRAFAAIASSAVHGAFAFWPAYAAVACRELAQALVPASLYSVAADALTVSGYGELDAVIRQYHSQVPASLDLGWTLKGALAGGRGSDVASPHAFFSMPDELLGVYAGLVPATGGDACITDLAMVRERLASLVAGWRQTEPRVFVYGTGTHTRRMFAMCPELGRFVGGFIDRSARGPFLGKPCVTPEHFRADLADVVVYSSREFEHEMYARLKQARVEHVLLYGASPAAPDATTAARLANRFGDATVNLAGLNAMYQPPSWATGYVSGTDAAFLAHMVAAHQPGTVVELGVASGASSAALLFALDQLPGPEPRTLCSCDVRPTCYFNDAYDTGQACREMYPAPRAEWRREFAMDARLLAQVLPPGGADLTFIDANHSHPWPLLDLLHLTACAKPGSWVILHDIELPIQHPEHQVYGPRWLFQAWPFNKVKGLGPWTSIGAVQLPRDLSQLVPMALGLLDQPWEQAPASDHIALPAPFASVREALAARLGRTATPTAAVAAPPPVQPAPAWVQGATPVGDAQFLREMVTIHAPVHMLELGVASGVSSAYLLHALDALPPVPGRRLLRSCDVNVRCYFDDAWATGEAVQTMYPRPQTRWLLDTDTDARRLSQSLPPHSVDLTFIDANHYHPWPLLDLLHVSVLAKPGSWVILHDINLPVIAPESGASGAKWLFDAWPFEKLAGGLEQNIGAVRLPDDLSQLVPYASALLDVPWEHAPTQWHVALPAPFASLQAALDRKLEPVAAL